MIKTRKTWLLAIALGLFSTLLNAQASRTWISGVGDDANPGSRTAPCKTFAGAISKTAAGGEIDCLDPGGFGALTITKAITLDGGGGQVASILVAATDGITINAGPSDVIIIRNLRINGTGSGLNGIRFIAGKALIIENCKIFGFINDGITCANESISDLTITHTEVSNCGNGLSMYTSPCRASIVHSNFKDSAANGILVESDSTVSLTTTTASNNASVGLFCYSGQAQIQAKDCTFNNNYYGVTAKSGVARISNCSITGNRIAINLIGGSVFSFGNNQIAGNTTGEKTSGIVALK